MKSVLHNFVGTFTSRNSDHLGYWLFGQLPLSIARLGVDLLGSPPVGDALPDVVERLAIRRFAEQLLVSGLERSVVREAALRLTRESTPVFGRYGGFEARGHTMTFLARVVMEGGTVVEHQRSAFLAAHDPTRERRRSRDDSGLSSADARRRREPVWRSSKA
jgi:hypothetical protein